MPGGEGLAFEEEAPGKEGCQEREIESKAAEEGQAERVDKEDIKEAGAFDGVLDDDDLDDAGDDTADKEGNEGAPEGGVVAFEVIDHHDGGDGQQVEQVDADGQAHHIKDEDDPFVGAGLIGILFPFEDGPEYEGGKKGGGGV